MIPGTILRTISTYGRVANYTAFLVFGDVQHITYLVFS